MRYLLLCLAISLPFAIAYSPIEESEVHPCRCCDCECPPDETKTNLQTEPTSEQIGELNRFYKSQSLKDKSFEIWMLEMEILNFDSYFMCAQCDHVAGPGIDHPFRHPASKRRPAPPQLDAETPVNGCGLDCSENLKLTSFE